MKSSTIEPPKKLGRPVGSRSSPDAKARSHKSYDLGPFAEWAKGHLVQSVDQWAGRPFELEGWQERFMDEAMSRNGVGYLWRSVALVLPRKNGKTHLLAAYALYRLFDDGQPEILLAASSDKQAGRLFDAVCSFLYRNPELMGEVVIRQHVGEIARKDGGGKIIRLASDPATLHGYNPSLVICDELHAWSKPSQRKAWAALTTGGGARQVTQTFTITTAGTAEERGESILGHLIDQNEQHGDCERAEGLTVSRNAAARTLVYNYSAPTQDPEDVEALKLANPASWITVDSLARQAANPELTGAEVLQLHGCVWAVGASAWLPAGSWAAIADPEREVEDGAKVVLGFDGSYNNDSTALVGCTIDERPHLFVVGVWERPPDARAWKVPRDDVEQTVRGAMERWDVREFPCDPPGWHREIDEWAETYGSPPVFAFETNKTGLMSEFCSRLYTAVVTAAVSHDGNPRLAAHIANAVVKERGAGAYISKEDRHSPRKIDLAVASVMAHGRAHALAGSGEAMVAWV